MSNPVLSSGETTPISENAAHHHTVLEVLAHGSKHYQCNYCNDTFKGTGTRCYIHLTGDGKGVAQCLVVPDAVISKLKAAKAAKADENERKRKIEEQEAQRKRDRRGSSSSSAAAAAAAAAGAGARASSSRALTPIEQAMSRADRTNVHKALADLIFFEGLPMRIVKSPWLRAFTAAVENTRGYGPPAYDTLRTTLLQDAKQRVLQKLQAWDLRVLETGVTICSDGWSDARSRSLLNVLAVNPKGPRFLTAFDTTGKAKTGAYISACILECILEVGAEHVIQVVTDNAANCKAAGKLIEVKYPHITWSPCAAHVCDLALEAIFALPFFKDVHSDTKAFVTFINNNNHTLAAWRQHGSGGGAQVAGGASAASSALALLKPTLALLKPGETRFATALLMIERTIKEETKLEQFVVSDGWNAAINGMKAADKATAAEQKQTILSPGHWQAATAAFDLCVPILVLLRHADSDSPSTSKIYWYAFKVQEHLTKQHEGIDEDVMDEVRVIWKERWDYMESPLHGAAYCLDPEFWGDTGLASSNSRDASVTNLRAMIRKLLPPDEASKARMSYESFRAREGAFAEDEALEDAAVMPAHQWWDMYGCAHPELQKLAIRLLSQVSSACSCERNWSSYDFIHNKRRNRLTAARARDLVFVFTNGRLVDKIACGEEQFIGWDSEDEMSEGEAGSDGGDE